MNFSIEAAMGLILGVMVLSFVTLAVLAGPINEALNQVDKDIEDETTSSPRVEIDSPTELAGIAKLSMDRAAECTSVSAHPYPDLEDTKIGRNPNCQLGLPGENFLRDKSGGDGFQVLGPGNDMEGVDSRIRFNITQDMTLSSDKRYGKSRPGDGTWAGGINEAFNFTLTGVSDKKYSDIITDTCNALGRKYSTSRTGTPTYGYILTFTTESSGRYISSGAHELITDTEKFKDSGGTYCRTGAGPGTTSSAASWLARIPQAVSTPDTGRTKVKLCEGDKGYVQVNKKKPYKTAETEDTSENAGQTPLFGYIQITESSGSCRVNDPIRPYEDDENNPKYSGDIFMAQLDVDNWPGPYAQEQFNPLDIVNKPGSYEANLPEPDPSKELPDNKCAIGLKEKGSNPNQEFLYTLTQGGIIIDSENGLPEKSSWSFPDSWEEGTLLTPGKPNFGVPRLKEDSGSKAWQLYERLRDEGFDGSKVRRSSLTDSGDASGDLILERESGHYLELYGPVLCGYETDNGEVVDASSGEAEAQWHLCLPDDATSGDNPTEGVQVADGDFTVKECRDGSWEKAAEEMPTEGRPGP